MNDFQRFPDDPADMTPEIVRQAVLDCAKVPPDMQVKMMLSVCSVTIATIAHGHPQGEALAKAWADAEEATGILHAMTMREFLARLGVPDGAASRVMHPHRPPSDQDAGQHGDE